MADEPRDFWEFMDFLILHGLEHFRKYYGVYRAKVTANNDPQQRGRIQIINTNLHSEPLEVWVDPVFPCAGPKRGIFWPPDVGDRVRIVFDRGDPGKPIAYWGGWFGENDDLPTGQLGFKYDSEDRPTQRGFITRFGHALLFNDEPDEEQVRIAWHKPAPGDPALTDPAETADTSGGEFAFIDLDKNGSIMMANAKGARMMMDAENKNNVLLDENGNSITTDKDGIKLIDKDGNLITIEKGDVTIVCKGNLNITCKSVNLKSGGVFLADSAMMSAVIGEQLIAYLASHTHNVPPPVGAPSGPPVPPPTPALLSKNVKLK